MFLTKKEVEVIAQDVFNREKDKISNIIETFIEETSDLLNTLAINARDSDIEIVDHFNTLCDYLYEKGIIKDEIMTDKAINKKKETKAKKTKTPKAKKTVKAKKIK